MLKRLIRNPPIGLVRTGRALAVIALAGGLSACVQPGKSMYSWQSYQPSVYAYLKDDGADHAAQALAMEKNIETSRATNAELPPGFRAHLGMLYLKTGEDAKGLEQIESEKVAFPESKPFMDFLLRNARGMAQDTARVGHPVVTAPADSAGPVKAHGKGE